MVDQPAAPADVEPHIVALGGDAVEDGLDPALFVRLHRSAIVRRDVIAGFARNPSGRWIARLADGNEQPVGRLYADQVRQIAGR